MRKKKESIIIDVIFSQVICFKNVKRFEMRGALSGVCPPYAESSAVGRDAKFNEVIKGVIIVFKIIFFNVLCRRRVGHWGCSGLHGCVLLLLLHMVSI